MGTTAIAIDKMLSSDFGCGDKKGQQMDAVLSRCLPSLYRRAFRYLGNAADAEDAVQDALLSALKNLEHFRGDAQMSTWLIAIVTNAALTQLRKRARGMYVSLDEQSRDQEGYALSERLRDRRPSPEEELRRAEHVAHLTHLARQLPPTLRRSFELRDLDGRTILEMADILRVPEGTVKAQISRARAKLGSLIEAANRKYSFVHRARVRPGENSTFRKSRQ
jgi:RNA polymerase sigma-70 factor (ECF subfamily)